MLTSAFQNSPPLPLAIISILLTLTSFRDGSTVRYYVVEKHIIKICEFNSIFFERGIPVRSMFTKISFQCSVASSETVYCCSISIYLVYMLLVCRHHSVVMCSWSPPDIQLTKQYTIRENHFPTL